MKKVGDLMADLGFREDAPLSVKEAFIKHLVKAAEGVEIQTPTEKRKSEMCEYPAHRTQERDQGHAQLSLFDVGPQNKKASSF